MGRKSAILLAALIAQPVWAQEYDPVLIPAQILGSPQTMTPVYGGDDTTRLVQFAFPFQYYGQTFTSAWVSSNGFISFEGPDDLCCNGQLMKDAQRNTIYAYWTDLIGGANPYYRVTDTSVLFGWYGTNEYGTQNKNTFEIDLEADGKIQINYGALANTYHKVSAGLTGPGADDNIQLFFGTNVKDLSFQSGLLSPVVPEPEVLPLSPVVVAPVPSPTPNPLAVEEDAQEPLAEVAVAEPVAETIVSETDTASETTITSISGDVEQETDAEVGAPPPGLLASLGVPAQEGLNAEVRRDRNIAFFEKEAARDASQFERETVMIAGTQNIAFLAQADAQYVQQFGEQNTTETDGYTQYLLPADGGPTFSPSPVTGMSDVTSPTSLTQQFEMIGMQPEMAAGQAVDVSDMNSQDAETMIQLSAPPAGYANYIRARIPDAPFYQPRDIYKGHRIPDANLQLYRMMQGQDRRWDEMVEGQYE